MLKPSPVFLGTLTSVTSAQSILIVVRFGRTLSLMWLIRINFSREKNTVSILKIIELILTDSAEQGLHHDSRGRPTPLCPQRFCLANASSGSLSSCVSRLRAVPLSSPNPRPPHHRSGGACPPQSGAFLSPQCGAAPVLIRSTPLPALPPTQHVLLPSQHTTSPHHRFTAVVRAAGRPRSRR